MALLHVAVNCYTSIAGIRAPHVYIERGTVGGIVRGVVRGSSGGSSGGCSGGCSEGV